MACDPHALAEHAHPSVRFLALTELLGRPCDDDEVRAAQAAIPAVPPVRSILDAQYPAGHWMHTGLGIAPHYRATAWQILFLAQFGVGRIPQVERAVEALLAYNPGDRGAFRVQRERAGASPALTAALLWALARLGFRNDSRLEAAWSWLQSRREVLADNPAAAVWTLRAAAAWERRVLLDAAVAAVTVLLRIDSGALMTRLTFPLVDWPDRLAALEALTEVGLAPDRVAPDALNELMERQGADGCWPLDHVPGRLWWNPGPVGESHPWVTLRALKVVRRTQT